MTPSPRQAGELLRAADPHPVTPAAHTAPAARALLRHLLTQRAEPAAGTDRFSAGPSRPGRPVGLREPRWNRSPSDPGPEVVRWAIDDQVRPGSAWPFVPRASRQRRHGFAVAAVVTAAVAVTAVVVVGQVPAGTSGAAPAGGAVGADSAAPPAAGWQRISSLGVEVDAPGAWPINAWSPCPATPTTPDIERADDGGPLCGGRYDPDHTLTVPVRQGLEVRQITVAQPTDPPATRRDATIDGLRVSEITRQLVDRSTQTVLRVPSRGVEVSVTLHDVALVSRIVSSVRAVDIDTVGCTTQLPPAPAWDHRAAGPGVDVGHPTSIGVCVYSNGTRQPISDPVVSLPVLVASASLTGTSAHVLATALDAAHAGAIPDVPDACSPEVASPPPVVLLLRYADGSMVQARVHFGGCIDRWVATPTGVSHPTVAQVDAILGPLRIGGLVFSYHGDLPGR